MNDYCLKRPIPYGAITIPAHCWHISMAQHAISYHRDEVCCFCNAIRCINEAIPNKGITGHGPFNPNR